jgi:single-stranded DNA-binding protein
MNQQIIHLMGRATDDAELLTTKKGNEFYKFSLAINEYRGEELESIAHFYDILSFSKAAKTTAARVKKGDIVFAIGKPSINVYESKDGDLKGNISAISSYMYIYTIK